MIRVFEVVVLYLRNRLIYKQPKRDNCLLLIVLQRIPIDLRGHHPRYSLPSVGIITFLLSGKVACMVLGNGECLH